ncbi:pteridine-dependent deoxygenase [Dokdonella sp.]|uniref:chorismate transformation enzyme, FkbO/Hyg5 family n=1 Tax=Dokdonella sp. TaxID=2291710 RepID=UPI0025C5A4FC|nr:pteridine-dependent deoxygenase [Dokdonella sp.]
MNHATPPLPALEQCYEQADVGTLLADARVLAVIGFGSGFAAADDPRVVRVALEPLAAPCVEVWRGRAPVRHGRAGDLRWSSDGDYLFVAIEVAEVDGDIERASHDAYRQLLAFVQASATPHWLRLWNYFDAINAGVGDAERYRRFCAGRARGMAQWLAGSYPAACAIGHQVASGNLLVYGLAAREPGTRVENPRQLSAWCYPRQYGPSAPTFARALRSAAGQFFISGTAAVVGHASQHEQDLAAQLAETFTNLEHLLAAAHGRFGTDALLKAYVRERDDGAAVAHALAQAVPGHAGALILGGDICRRELLVEIDGLQSLAR